MLGDKVVGSDIVTRVYGHCFAAVTRTCAAAAAAGFPALAPGRATACRQPLAAGRARPGRAGGGWPVSRFEPHDTKEAGRIGCGLLCSRLARPAAAAARCHDARTAPLVKLL